MKILALNQGSEEWKEWRKTVITGTDAPVILGHSKYCTPYLLWQRKVGEAPEQVVNSAMLRGQKDEPIARELFIKEYGIEVTPACIQSSKYNFLGSSLDGISKDAKILIEVKSQKPVESVSEMHYDQIQEQLLSTDGIALKSYYISHWEGKNTTVEVYPDLEWQKNFIGTARDFWEKVFFRIPPEISAKDYQDLSLNEGWRSAAEQYILFSRKKEQIEESLDMYRKQLIEYAKESNAKGAGVKLIKRYCKGRIDYKEAMERLAIPLENLEEYRKAPSCSWAVTIE